MRLLIIITLLYFSVAIANARNNNIPDSAQAEILRAYPGVEVTFKKHSAIGDLDADGIDDLITIIEYKKNNQALERLVVLTGTIDKKYNFSSQSAAWERENNGRRSIFISIKKSSIFISGNGSTSETYFGTEYQFKKYDKNFMMIGVTNTSGKINSEDKREESINLLNSKTLTVIVENGKREEFNDKLRKVYRIKLDEFSFDNEIEFK